MTVSGMEELEAQAFQALVYRWIVSIVAVALAVANGISWTLSAVMLGFGLATDLYRGVVRRQSEDTRRALRLSTLIVGHPRLPFWVAGAVVLRLVAAWLLLSDVCAPDINAWIEANFHLARWRMAALGPTCSVRHGSVLLWSQAIMPPLTILFIGALGILADSNQFVYDQFNKNRSQDKENKLTFGGGLILFTILLLFLIATQPIINFGEIPHYNRPIPADKNMFSYLFVILLCWSLKHSERIL